MVYPAGGVSPKSPEYMRDLQHTVEKDQLDRLMNGHINCHQLPRPPKDDYQGRVKYSLDREACDRIKDHTAKLGDVRRLFPSITKWG